MKADGDYWAKRCLKINAWMAENCLVAWIYQGGFLGLPELFLTPLPLSFAQAQPKSRANAVLSATADLDDDDLEE